MVRVRALVRFALRHILEILLKEYMTVSRALNCHEEVLLNRGSLRFEGPRYRLSEGPVKW